MPSRRKRLGKGAESIRKQIGLHRDRLEKARQSGNIGLAEYYEKELESLELALDRKKAFLGKSK